MLVFQIGSEHVEIGDPGCHVTVCGPNKVTTKMITRSTWTKRKPEEEEREKDEL